MTPDGHGTDGQTKRLIGARATALPKNVFERGNQYWVEYQVQYWVEYWVEYWVSILGSILG